MVSQIKYHQLIFMMCLFTIKPLLPYIHKFGKCVIYTILIHGLVQIIFVSNVEFVISQYCLVVCDIKIMGSL